MIYDCGLHKKQFSFFSNTVSYALSDFPNYFSIHHNGIFLKFMMNHLLTFIIVVKSVLSLMLRNSHAKYVEGHLIVAEKWFFIARFCFLSEHGQFQYFVEYSKEYAVQNLLLYYDSDSQWPSVYKTQKTCEEKEAVLRLNQNQIINLTDSEYASGCTIVKNHYTSASHHDENALITCQNVRRFHSARPRWWFLAVSHCNASNGLNIKYKFLMTNGAPGDVWREHFSADEFYIIPLLATFFLMYLFVLGASLFCSVQLKSRQLLHSTYKLFTLSIISEEIGIILQCVAYMRYGYDGIGFPAIKTFGRMLESTSEICFLLLLLLMAKGYTITRGRLRLASSVKLTVFMCAYIVTTLGLYMFEYHVFDPGEVLYLYESPAGYGLIILRGAAWWMFEYSNLFTLKHYPEKSNFYYRFNAMGTLWFVSGPCFTFIANLWIDKWIREGVVCGVFHLIALSGHTFFLLLTVPNNANKNFPYHVRTSQIDVMEVAEPAGNRNLYNFGHHPYAPYTPSAVLMEEDRSNIRTPDVPIDLFSVRHATPPTSTKSSIPKSPNRDQLSLEKDLNVYRRIINSSRAIHNGSLVPFHTSQNHSIASNSPEVERVFTVETFVAPSLRNKRTLSA